MMNKKKQSSQLILLRHGASIWNEKNLFTGWVDIPLSPKGIEESIRAGQKIAHLPIDVIFVSSLVRAQMTAFLAMSVHKGDRIPCVLHPGEGKLDAWAKIFSREAAKSAIPVHVAWQLNERMYGTLQGMNKDEMRKKYGADQVHMWRRSFDIAPPKGESLKDTARRSIPFFKKKILPLLKRGKNVFISAHGNSLRSIVMFLDHLTAGEVVQLEIPTGAPLLYTFSGDGWEKNDL